MTKVVVIGAGEHGQMIASIIGRSNELQFIGFVDDNVEPTHSNRVLGKIQDLPQLDTHRGVLGIGETWTRVKVLQQIFQLLPFFRFATVVDPSALVDSTAVLGEGTVVFPGSIINRGTNIGKHCIINTGSIIEHTCLMEDLSSAAPGVIIGGDCIIGTRSWVGLGARLKHGITVGHDTIIGAGAVVIDDIPAKVVAHGIPAKVSRKRRANERFL